MELKALEIFKKVQGYSSLFDKYGDFLASRGEIDEAIAELEALQAPKTCETCDKLPKCYLLRFIVPNFVANETEFGCIYHNPKDNQCGALIK